MKKTLLYAIIAGICIGLGGTVCLSVENSVIGAMLFSIGLLTILSFGFNLFTGKVCYTLDNPPSYLGTLGIIWVGNLIGSVLMALLVRFTRAYASVHDKAAGMVETKLSDGPVSILLLAIGCGICIYIAVQAYKTQTSTLKCVFVVLPVMVFILCKFEHVVADMFYFALAYEVTFETPVRAILYLLLMTLGNSIGGMLFPALMKLSEKKEN